MVNHSLSTFLIYTNSQSYAPTFKIYINFEGGLCIENVSKLIKALWLCDKWFLLLDDMNK